MKEIIGDDYPTYEDSVKQTLAEREKEKMYLDKTNTWRMECGCTEANVLDGNHNVCNNKDATDFTDDEEKMADFNKLTKQEFLDSYSYLTEQEYELTMNQVRLLQEERDVSKNNIERLLQENFELRHRLACIADDIEIIDRHIQKNCNKKFKKPSLNADGSIYADQAWHNVSNIEIACDLNDDEPLYWGAKNELTKDQIMEMEQQIR